MKIAASSSTHIATRINEECATLQTFRRSMLMKVLSCIRYLARQGLPLRGHNNDIEGNLHQLLLLQAEDNSRMKEWIIKREYISPSIVNEIIVLMGQVVLRDILEEIRGATWFSLIVDEATDVAHNEQLSLSIRWVDHHYTIHEDTLGLVQLENTKANTLYSVIKDILIRCSLPIAQCRGQAFDGASNMSGIRNGVQALVKQVASQALYVHCLAHSLNLCIQEVSKKCDLVRNVMELIYELVQLIKFSPKRQAIFDHLRKDVALQTGGEVLAPSLRTLCPTRWTVRGGSIESVLHNYKLLQEALHEIQQGHDEYAAKAHGILNRMESFDTYFGLNLALLVFSAAEQLSTNLQAKNITIQEATHGAALLTSHMSSLRNESKFNCFYQEVLEKSSTLTEEPKLPRSRKVPRRFDEGSSPHQYLVPKDRYRHAYFEVMELATGEVERRFDQSDLHTIRKIEQLMLDACNGNDYTSFDDVLCYLKDDVDYERFKAHLSMLPDLIKVAFKDSVPVKKVTNVRTIAEAMEQSVIYKDMLSEVDKVLKIFFTFPVTSATAEWSFSSLRRLKTFLRSTMSDCRLNNLFLLYIHTSRTDALNLEKVAKDFIAINQRRINYFGNV